MADTDESLPYDECGACGMRRDAHIPGIGNTHATITCPEYRSTDEEGLWVWVSLKKLEALRQSAQSAAWQKKYAEYIQSEQKL